MNIQNNNMVLNGIEAQQLFEFGKAGDTTSAQMNPDATTVRRNRNVAARNNWRLAMPGVDEMPVRPRNVRFVQPRPAELSKADAKRANSVARQTFLRYILKTCGIETVDNDYTRDYGLIDQLPDVVRSAMKCKGFIGLFKKGDWKASNQRPLSSRRIAAVMEALEVHKRERKYAAENGGAEMPAAVRKLFRNDPKLVRQYSYSLVADACGVAPDAFVAFVKGDEPKRLLGERKFSRRERDGKADFQTFCREFRDSMNKVVDQNDELRSWEYWNGVERNQWLKTDDKNFVNAYILTTQDNGGVVKTSLRQKLSNPDKCKFDEVFGNLSTAQKTKILRLINTTASNGFIAFNPFARLLGMGDDVRLSGNNLTLDVTIVKTGDGKWHFKVDVRQLLTGVTVGGLLFSNTHKLVGPENQQNLSAKEAEKQRKTHSAANCTLEYDVTADAGDEITVSDMTVVGGAHLRQFKSLAVGEDMIG